MQRTLALTCWLAVAGLGLTACDASDEGPCVDPWGRSCEELQLPEIAEVEVPAGEFQMGCNAALDDACEPHEAPQHAVQVPRFAVDLTEVTASAFAAFLNAQGPYCGGGPCVYELKDMLELFPLTESAEGAAVKPGMERRPMNYVTWYGADAFCTWMEQALCTEAQWEKAARGGCERQPGDCAATTRIYPWGNAPPTCELAVMREHDAACDTEAPWDVGSRPAGAGPYGALDMAGNVWEWVADPWHGDFVGAVADGSTWDGGDAGLRVIRGGGGSGVEDYQRASVRGAGGLGDGGEWRGFRCCRWL